jgi:hypothetical protein
MVKLRIDYVSKNRKMVLSAKNRLLYEDGNGLDQEF